MSRNRHREAISESLNACRLAPGSPVAAMAFALSLLRAGDYHRALIEFDHAVALGADRNRVAVTLSDAGATLASGRNLAEVEPFIKKALQLEPGLRQAQTNLLLLMRERAAGADHIVKE